MPGLPATSGVGLSAVGAHDIEAVIRLGVFDDAPNEARGGAERPEQAVTRGNLGPEQAFRRGRIVGEVRLGLRRRRNALEPAAEVRMALVRIGHREGAGREIECV